MSDKEQFTKSTLAFDLSRLPVLFTPSLDDTDYTVAHEYVMAPKDTYKPRLDVIRDDGKRTRIGYKYGVIDVDQLAEFAEGQTVYLFNQDDQEAKQ